MDLGRCDIPVDSQPFIRQNDSGGTDATHWSDWKGLMLPSNVTGEKGITVTTTQTTLGSGDNAVSYDSGVKIGVGTSLTISGTTRNTTVYGTDNPKLFFGMVVTKGMNILLHHKFVRNMMQQQVRQHHKI